MRPNVFARLVLYCADRQTFTKVVATAVGVPAAVGMLWMFGSHGGPDWWVILVLLSLAGSWLYAFFMWYAVEADIRRIARKFSTQRLDD